MSGPLQTEDYLAFFRASEKLKDTLRSGFTSGGRPESTAEHTWRLCLMAVALEDRFDGIDFARLLPMLVIHDLGEAIGGDIPAPEQSGGDKTANERADFLQLLALLPESPRARLLALWDDYNSLASPEARLAKGLDRLETVLQHTQGQNPADFDYAFNLGYGRVHTDPNPVIAALRAPVDEATRMRDLERFVTAQAPVWDRVLAELRAGRKRTHWMWFIFPQIAGLGRSDMARRYALGGLAAARAYLVHPLLGPRLREATEAMRAHAGTPVDSILGPVDAAKFRSSLTLFNAAHPEEDLFRLALEAFFEGAPDPLTIDLLGRADL